MMNKEEVYKLLAEIISCKMTANNPQEKVMSCLTGDVVSALYKLSHRLDFAHVVYAFLSENGVQISEELEKKFKKAQNLAVYRSTMMEYELQACTRILKDENVDFVLLKGAVLRGIYPKDVIRTSCDIDILIKDDDKDRAVDRLCESGYQIIQRNFHDVPFTAPSGAKVELHFSICEQGLDKANDVLCRVWEHTVKDGQSDSALTKEFFLFHHFTHMAFHFINGGCGIKPLVDLYIIEQKMGVTAEDIKDLLEKAGLYKFADEMTQLCRAMFDGELSDFHITLLSYIIEGGAYGRIDNKVALGKSESGGTIGYMAKRFFLPYKAMAKCYPILKKLPFLLPFFWIIRIFHRLFSKDRGKVFAEVNQSASVSKKKVSNANVIRKRLGL